MKKFNFRKIGAKASAFAMAAALSMSFATPVYAYNDIERVFTSQEEAQQYAHELEVAGYTVIFTSDPANSTYTVTANIEDSSIKSVTSPGTSDCEVSTTVPADYVVKLPLSATLTKKVGCYEGTTSYTVKGLLPTDKVLNVSYPKAIKMSDESIDNTVIASINGGTNPGESYTDSFYSGTGVDCDGDKINHDTVISHDLIISVERTEIPTAGDFSGTLQFTISLIDRV